MQYRVHSLEPFESSIAASTSQALRANCAEHSASRSAAARPYHASEMKSFCQQLPQILYSGSCVLLMESCMQTVALLAEAGAAAVTVHGRTAEQR